MNKADSGLAAAGTAGGFGALTAAASCCVLPLALAGTGVDVAWYTTREREEAEVLPWDHIDSGLDKEWLWQDWLDAVDETEVEDCRWTPCFDCGVCPQMGTEIEIGPTGKTLLPVTVLGGGKQSMVCGA